MLLKNSREVEMRCWKEAVGLMEMLERKNVMGLKSDTGKRQSGGCQRLVGK